MKNEILDCAETLTASQGHPPGGALYALTFPWVEAKIQRVGQLGKVTVPELTNMPEGAWLLLLSLALALVLYLDRSKTSVEQKP